MNIGMLWFDNDPKTDLAVKVSRAAAYYQSKYGQTPNLCFVHPSMVKSGLPKTNGVEIRSSRSVMPNHLWMGLSNDKVQ
jgi:hypothetical protein